MMIKRFWRKIRGIKTAPATITLEKLGDLTAIKKNGVLLAYSDLPLSTDGEFITSDTVIQPENIMIAASLPPLQMYHTPERTGRIEDLRYRSVDPTGGALLRELVDSIAPEDKAALLALYAKNQERGGRSLP